MKILFDTMNRSHLKTTKHRRRKPIRLSEDAYRAHNVFSLTATTHQRYPWFQIHPQMNLEAILCMVVTAKDRNAKIYAWCIMPDHVHLLLQDSNCVEFMRLFKGRMTAIARYFDPIRLMWQRSFYDHAVRCEESLSDAARYIWENPVRTGLVAEASRYSGNGSMAWPDWRRRCVMHGLDNPEIGP